jgi:cystathionine gamma-synthase
MDHINTLLAHTAFVPDSETAAVIPPVHFSTTYERAQDNSYPSGFVYAREGNPTRQLLEQTLTQLEGGVDCRAFASGMAASHAVLQALPPQSHVIIPDDVYHGFKHLVAHEADNGRLTYSTVDMSDIEQVNQSISANTQLIWVETPSNPLLKITDIRAISDLANTRGISVAVDGTWTTPVLQRPFDLGAHIVIHSLTKYIAGHSDVLGGAVICKQDGDFLERLRQTQTLSGAVLDPFSSWLTLRGLRTLAVRIKSQCESAGAIARFLSQHKKVTTVHYPGLPTHAGHEIANQQMAQPGGMLSIEIEGSEPAAISVAATTRLFRRATSLGGTESLIEHRASVEGPDTTTPAGLLRLSIGLEYEHDLIADLDRALTKI